MCFPLSEDTSAGSLLRSPSKTDAFSFAGQVNTSPAALQQILREMLMLMMSS